MSHYINAGARNPATGALFPSKKALREAIRDTPGDVLVFGTSAFTLGDYRADEIPAGVNFSIVGPDPYTSRKYYATLTRTPAGKLKLS